MNAEVTLHDVVTSIQEKGDPEMISLIQAQMRQMKEMYEALLNEKDENHKQAVHMLKERELDMDFMREQIAENAKKE